MKTTAVGLVVLACLGALAIGQWNAAWAQRGVPGEAGTELITITAASGDKFQQLTVIDPRLRVMSVYHLELATGAITLRSVRNINWDLQLSEFNGVSPLPREIRAMVDPR